MLWVVTSSALVGRMAISAAYQILYLHCGELFPTEVRTRGMGTAAMVSKIGNTVAPFIVDTLVSATARINPSFLCAISISSENLQNFSINKIRIASIMFLSSFTH